MGNRVIQVPVSLLSDPEVTPSFKVIWMALRLEPGAGPGRLEALTGLSRHTILSGLAQMAKYKRLRGGRWVEVPGALLAERRVGARAKVLYGMLQTIPQFRGHSGQFTYLSLSAHTRLSRSTLRLAMAELTGAGWVSTTQKSRVLPIHIKLGTPQQRRAEAEARAAARRLKHAKYVGEALMQEYLSLLIDSADFADNVKPGWLVNPLTNQLLELDRFYRPNVAFEFQGEQHYRPSERFSQHEVDGQKLRDLIKAGLCLHASVHLVLVYPEDLSLQGMIQKVGHLMPLRPLAGRERLINLLEEESMRYLTTAQVSPRSGHGN